MRESGWGKKIRLLLSESGFRINTGTMGFSEPVHNLFPRLPAPLTNEKLFPARHHTVQVCFLTGDSFSPHQDARSTTEKRL
jgi:hypothetical protein